MSEAQVQILSRQIVKKITPKVVAGKVNIETLINFKNAEKNEKAIMPLFHIFGMASGFTAGETALGPYMKLLGQFKAVNRETGQEFVSGCAILPGAASDLIYGAVRALGDEGGTVEFAFRVGIQRDETTPIGYVYVIEQVMQPGQSDPLKALEQRFLPPALSAPQSGTSPAGAAPASSNAPGAGNAATDDKTKRKAA